MGARWNVQNSRLIHRLDARAGSTTHGHVFRSQGVSLVRRNAAYFCGALQESRVSFLVRGMESG
ncbi:hypothetical protein ACFPRL_15900 [Pseudoclavibacter helvolus]